MFDYCGMSRSETGLLKALSEIPALYEEFLNDVRILGTADGFNQSLERAGRVEDYFELAQAMCLDALHREESCGGHFREEYQTAEGEALRRDEEFAHVAVWEWTGDPAKPELNIEPLEFENVALAMRSYK
jgi:succinate dehydrogenase / fumarate reductase flavoprotein subunit